MIGWPFLAKIGFLAWRHAREDKLPLNRIFFYFFFLKHCTILVQKNVSEWGFLNVFRHTAKLRQRGQMSFLWCGKFARRYNILSSKPGATSFSTQKRARPPVSYIPSITPPRTRTRIVFFIRLDRGQLLSLMWSCLTFSGQLTCQHFATTKMLFYLPCIAQISVRMIESLRGGAPSAIHTCWHLWKREMIWDICLSAMPPSPY